MLTNTLLYKDTYRSEDDMKRYGDVVVERIIINNTDDEEQQYHYYIRSTHNNDTNSLSSSSKRHLFHQNSLNIKFYIHDIKRQTLAQNHVFGIYYVKICARL